MQFHVPVGIIDPIASFTTATNNISVDPYLFTVSSVEGAYPGRMISITGAGPGGNDLLTTINAVSIDSGINNLRVTRPASTNVVGAVIDMSETPVWRDYGRVIATAASPDPKFNLQSGDIFMHGLPQKWGPAGWVAHVNDREVAPLPLGIVGTTIVPWLSVTNVTASNLVVALQAAGYMPSDAVHGYHQGLITRAGIFGELLDSDGALQKIAMHTAAGVNSANLYADCDIRHGAKTTSNGLVDGENMHYSESCFYYRSPSTSPWHTTAPLISPVYEEDDWTMIFDPATNTVAMSRNQTGTNTYPHASESFTLVLRGFSPLVNNATGSIWASRQAKTNSVYLVLQDGSLALRFYDGNGSTNTVVFEHEPLVTTDFYTVGIIASRLWTSAVLLLDGRREDVKFLPQETVHNLGVNSATDEQGFYAESGGDGFKVRGMTSVFGPFWFGE